MDTQEVFDLLLRYFILLLFGFFGISLFYFIFTPLTVWPVYLVLHKLYAAQLLEGNVIFFKGYYANIINACVAGTAYFALLTLNLVTPMRLNKRIKSILFLFSAFLVINIIRIIVFAMIVSVGYKYFDVAHMLTWYLGSTLLVVVVWFVNVWLFNIEGIPIYTDAQQLVRDIRTPTIKVSHG
jgi:exosortase/archaeosortase family protein